MKIHALPLVFGCLSLVLPTMSAAATAEFVEGWDVSGGDGSCGMLRPYDKRVPMWVVISRRSDGQQFLRAHHPAWRVKRGADMSVTLTFDGTPLVLPAKGSITDGAHAIGGFVALGGLDWQSRLAVARTMTITLPGYDPLPVDMTGVAAAAVALEKCVDTARTAGEAPLQTLPRPRTSIDLTAADYPAQARATARAGQTTVRLAVDATGVPTACEVRRSSGSPDLDEQTCRLAMARMRFDPATTTDGRPAAATFQFAVRWQL